MSGEKINAAEMIKSHVSPLTGLYVVPFHINNPKTQFLSDWMLISQ